MNEWHPEKLRDFFFHYDWSSPNHVAAVDLLQKHAAEIMRDDSEWVKVFRGGKEDTSYLQTAADLIKQFEGFSATAYKCKAGIYTIGYGSTYYEDGTLVWPTDSPISKERATEIMNYHIDNAVVPVLERTVPTWGLMGPGQKAAIISFAYNLGAHFYGGNNFKTMTKALSTKDNWKQVPSALMLYVNPGSTFEAGLKRRRKAEGELWKKEST